MFPQLDVLRMAGGLAANAEARQTAVARNIANANTPGYRAVDVPSFAASYAAASDFQMRETLPGHLSAIADTASTTIVPRKAQVTETPDGNTVSLEKEMMEGAEAKQQHDMALAIYRSATSLLRISLGVAK